MSPASAAAGPGEALAGIEGSRRRLDSYTGLFASEAWVAEPASLDELRSVLAYARESGRRLTLRAGANSFDAQAIGDDVVISTARLDGIELVEPDRVRVGPGARWGDILAALEPHGLVPAVTVTTERATAGGTLSAGCLSRFSPAYGKEGKWVESFELMTTEGEVLNCTEPPPGTGWEEWTREQRAYYGAVGGLGYLGVVVAVTYRLLQVGAGADGEIAVRTSVRTYETFANLARDLVPATRETYLEDSDPDDPGKLDAVWAALISRRDGRERALLFTASYTTDSKRRRMLQHRPGLWVRVPFEWLMRIPAVSMLLWRVIFRVAFSTEEYVDDLEGFTFFMDGNSRAKRVARRLGLPMRNIQQTFVVPFDPAAAAGWGEARDSLVEWLEAAQELLGERGLRPTLLDVLFLPGDDPFLLSATRAGPGFAVSYAFETSRRGTLERAQEAFTELSDLLWERFGGRVHLVKNVFARPATLAAMYEGEVERFVELKRELDPGGLLRNDFLERTFGELV